MDSDNLMQLGMVIMGLSVIAFFIGLCKAIFFKNERKNGVNILIWSIVFFIIGFGTCAANFTLHGMH